MALWKSKKGETPPPYMIIGVGELGGVIADTFAKGTEYPAAGIVAINTDPRDLEGVKTLPGNAKIYLKAIGVGGRWKISRLGTYARLNDEIMNTIPYRKNFSTSPIHIFTLGLGGGTGSGAVPILAEKLRNYYIKEIEESDITPESKTNLLSLAAGILPYGEEDKNFYFNTVCCISNLLDTVDGVILFDTDKIRTYTLNMPGGWPKYDPYSLFRTFKDKYDHDVRKYFAPVMAKTLHLLTTSEENRMDYQDIRRVSREAIPDCATSLIVPCISVNIRGKKMGDEKHKEKIRSVSDLILKTAMYCPLVECDPTTATSALFVYSGKGKADEIEKAEKELKEFIYGDSVKGTSGGTTEDEMVVLLLFNPDIPKLDKALLLFSRKIQEKYTALIKEHFLSITDLFRASFRLVSYLKKRNENRMELDRIRSERGESVKGVGEMPYKIHREVIGIWKFLFGKISSADKPEIVGIRYKEDLHELITLLNEHHYLIKEVVSEDDMKYQVEKLQRWESGFEMTLLEYIKRFRIKPKTKPVEPRDLRRPKEIKPPTPPREKRVEEIIKEIKLPPLPEKKPATVKPVEKERKPSKEDFEKKLSKIDEKMKEMNLKFMAKGISADLYKSTIDSSIGEAEKLLDKARDNGWISKKRYNKKKREYLSKKEHMKEEEEVNKLLKVLDELLGKLPKDVIDEFVKSEDYKLYEKVFLSKKEHMKEEKVEEKVNKLLKVLDELLGKLPKDVIDEFVKSEDYKLYEKVLDRYGV